MTAVSLGVVFDTEILGFTVNDSKFKIVKILCAENLLNDTFKTYIYILSYKQKYIQLW